MSNLEKIREASKQTPQLKTILPYTYVAGSNEVCVMTYEATMILKFNIIKFT